MDFEMNAWKVLVLDSRDSAAPDPLRALEPRGWSVRRCDNAPAFLQELADENVDLALVRQTSAGPDLLTLLGAAQSAAGEIPVVVIAGNDPETCRRVSSAGPVLLLDESMDPDLVEVALGAITRRHARMRQADADARSLQGRLRAEQSRSHRYHQRIKELIHEMGTSVTILRGYCSNLLDGIDGPIPEAPANSIKRMKVASEVLSGVLTRAREQTVKDRPPSDAAMEEARARRRNRLRLGELAGEVVRLVEPTFLEKGVSLVLDSERNCPMVWGDRVRLAQLIICLLNNALRHTPAGGSVTVSLAPDNIPTRSTPRPACHLTVADTGEGIAAEDLESIFLPGWSRAANEGNDHAGLGLAVCRDVTEEHGGKLWVESQPGHGATFHLVLPLDPRARQTAQRITVVDDPDTAGHFLLELGEKMPSRPEVVRMDDPEELRRWWASERGGLLVMGIGGPGLQRILARLEGESGSTVEQD